MHELTPKPAKYRATREACPLGAADASPHPSLQTRGSCHSLFAEGDMHELTPKPAKYRTTREACPLGAADASPHPSLQTRGSCHSLFAEGTCMN